MGFFNPTKVSHKKSSYLMARPLREAGPLRKSNLFEARKKIRQKNLATQLDRGKALVAGPLKKYFFLRLPYEQS